MNFATRIDELQPTAVNRVLEEVRALGRPTVSLMRGQPDFPTPAHIVQAVKEALDRGRTGYPDQRGEANLRQAIAAKLRREQGLEYDWKREILVTDGATGGLFTALGTLLEPGQGVLLADPIYDAYHAPIRVWKGVPIPVPSRRHDDRFVLDPTKIDPGNDAKVLLLNTPWNPVGTIFTQREVEDLVQFAQSRDLWILSDEIYEHTVYDGKSHLSPARWARERTILVNSLSKTYAMTGWRCGYCAGPAEAIERMQLLWQQFSRGPATFVQDAAAAALGGDQDCVTAMSLELQSRRDQTLEALSGITGVRPLKPEGGLFVMLDIAGLGRPSEDVRRHLLQKAGVVVIHGSAYGPGGEGLLRVSFAGGGETLRQGLTLLRQGLLDLSKGG